MIELKVILGSTRPNRGGVPVARWVVEAARQHGGFDVQLVDLAEVALPLLDEPEHPARQQYVHDHTKAWSQVIADADAFIFVTPEYDYFPSAVLVNAVQCLSREWARKPAGIVSYGGISGGLRAAQALRLLLSGVNLVTTAASVPLPLYTQFIGEDGAFAATPPVEAGLRGVLDDVAFFAGRLAQA